MKKKLDDAAIHAMLSDGKHNKTRVFVLYGTKDEEGRYTFEQFWPVDYIPGRLIAVMEFDEKAEGSPGGEFPEPGRKLVRSQFFFADPYQDYIKRDKAEGLTVIVVRREALSSRR